MRDEKSPSRCQVSVKNKKFGKNKIVQQERFIVERALRSAMLSEVEVMSLTELTDLRDVKTTGSIPDEYKFHSTGTEGQQPESLHKHS